MYKGAMRVLLLVLATLLPLCAYGDPLQTGSYNDYTGTIGGKYEIYMTLYAFSNGTIKGHYFYTKFNKKIPLIGSDKGNHVHVKVLDKAGKVAETFDGVLRETNKEGDVFLGTWKEVGTKKTLPFDLELRQIIGAQWQERYGDMGGRVGPPSEDEVEAYAAKVKAAILSSKINWLANNMDYPTPLTVNGRLVHIKNRDQFIKVAPSALSRKFKSKLAKLPTMDLYAENDTAAIGPGTVWIIYESKSLTGEGPFKFKIETINN